MFGIKLPRSTFDRSSRARRTRSRNASCAAAALAAALDPLEDRTLLSADLTGSITSAPVVVSGGTRQAITFSLTNEGSSTLRGSQTVTFYATPVGTAFNPATSTLLGSVARGGTFLPGATRLFTVNVPFGPQLSTGLYQIFGVINPGNSVAETNNASNVIQSNAISVTEPNFDLAVGFGGNINIPMTTTTGVVRNGTVQVIVSNPSTSTATIPAGQSVNVDVFAEPFGATSSTGGTLLNRGTTMINVGRLAPGQSRTINVPVQLPADLSVGAMNVVARINTTGTIAESSTLNNQVVLPSPLVINAAPVGTSNTGAGSSGAISIGTTPGAIAIGDGGSITGSVGTVGTIGAVGTGGAIGVTPGASSFSVGGIGGIGVTPTSAGGITPLTSTGLTTLNFTGTTPFDALGLTPTTSIGLFTPTTLGDTLSASTLGSFIV